MSLAQVIEGRLAGNLDGLSDGIAAAGSAFPLSREWLQRDWNSAQHVAAKSLLMTCKVAQLDAATSWALGLNRGAGASLRVYIESSFAWLYYKDHPVEFSLVMQRVADLLLPKAVQAYLRSCDAAAERVYAQLVKRQSRTSEYFYSAVSNFVHAHPSAGDNVTSLEEAVVVVPRDKSFLSVAAMADEFISDNYAVFYRRSWDDMPSLVRQNLTSRLKPGELTALVG